MSSTLPPNFPKVSKDTPASILFVCLGNICRSPTGEGVLQHIVTKKQLNIQVDSAGTANYHTGEHPHPPSIKHAAKRGYDISKLRARQFVYEDFSDFDLILAADNSNVSNILRLAKTDDDRARVKKVTDYLPENTRFKGANFVPDPYYEDAPAYEHVLDLCEEALDNLVHIIEQHSAE